MPMPPFPQASPTREANGPIRPPPMCKRSPPPSRTSRRPRRCPAPGLLALLAPALAAAAAAQDVQRARLDNGAEVLVLAVPGTGLVAVESFHRIGFAHDPAGLPQAAHLLEHLMCNGATAEDAPGEGMARLTALGMANAETMADWTHYDYVVPPDGLELALRTEAARLGSLVIDEAIVRQEGPRCSSEVDFVERNPRAGMLKFGFMALHQAWRHGRTEVRVRTGLDEYPVEALQRFWRQCYRPSGLTVVIVGDCDPAAALAMAREHLGPLAEPDVGRPAPTDWSRTERRSTVRWDSRVRAVCLAWPPPAEPLHRVVLTAWGALLSQQLAADPAVRAATHTVFAPSHAWCVGELPFFVYAAPADDVPEERIEALLCERLAEAAASGRIDTARIAAYARSLAARHQRLAPAAVERTARLLGQRGSDDPVRTTGMVLGQGALDLGAVRLFLGAEPETTAGAVAALEDEEVAAIVQAALGEERRIVTWLQPAAERR